jgi:hypothetical protein
VPEPGNPQSLNRYSYALNNPMRYTDPTGHANPLDPERYDKRKSRQDFRTDSAWRDYLLSVKYIRKGQNDEWTYNDWQIYENARKLVGEDSLQYQVSSSNKLDLFIEGQVFGAAILINSLQSGDSIINSSKIVKYVEKGDFYVVEPGLYPPNTGGMTIGDIVNLPKGDTSGVPGLSHEWDHVLTYRELGIVDFLVEYAKQGCFYNWACGLEVVPQKVTDYWRANPWLPPLNEFPSRKVD